MFDLAIEISNMTQDDCTPNKMLSLFARHQFYCSEYGSRQGFEEYAYVGGRYFLFKEGAFPPAEASKFTVFPSQSDFSTLLWNEIKEFQQELREIFDSIIENKQLLPNIARKLVDGLELRLKTIQTDDKFQYRFEFETESSTFEWHVLAREFALPLYHGEGDKLARIRKCPECGTYFYAPDIRKTFCSVKCRNANAYKAKTQQ